MTFKRLLTLLYAVPALVLAACSTNDPNVTNNDEDLKTERERRYDSMGKFFGQDALIFDFGKEHSEAGATGIGVNAFLWRASLDTISFMPLKSVDPFGGVILTRWYNAPNTQNERMKVDIFILGRKLRADGVKVSVFRQELKNGRWVDVAVDPSTAEKLEDVILTRARQLRISDGKG